MRVCLLLASLLTANFSFASACPTESLVLYRNQEFHLTLMFYGRPAADVNVELTTNGKAALHKSTGAGGTVSFGILPAGRYHIVIRRWGTLNLLVRPEEGSNGPWFTWFVLKPGVRNPDGTQMPSPACPVLSAVSD